MRGSIVGVIAAGVLSCGGIPVHCSGESSAFLPEGASACEVSVYAIDPDPKGINVRANPNKNAAVLQIIPHDPDGTVVVLAASYGDWVLIHTAEGMNSDIPLLGKGWVYAPLLAVRAGPPSGKKARLFSRPDPGSSVIKTIAGESEVRLAGCSAAWVQVISGTHKGWLAPGDYCGNPVTTCP